MKLSFRKNYGLIIAFLILISALFVIALTVSYTLTNKFVDNEFEANKVDILKKSVQSYDDFVKNKVAEVSFYQGFMDSLSGKKYAEDVFKNFPFVERVVFFDNDISQKYIHDGLKFRGLFLSPKAIYQYKRDSISDATLLYKAGPGVKFSFLPQEDFNSMAIKFAGFISTADTTRPINNEEIFNTFYSIMPGKISYMTLPSREEVSYFQKMLNSTGDEEAVYQQDIVTFHLNPTWLKIHNAHPQLYQDIEIKPVFYESVNEFIISTEISFPGALSAYKIYITSSPEFIKAEVNSRFLPIAVSILIIYIILLIVAQLIYRNLNINLRMFKLQYDFVNNLSHEFKTPVSVIKIAGSNIKSAKLLSEKEKDFYGKILEEEADKLNNLLNTLLSFTQIENKVITPKMEDIDLNEFCRSMVDSYRVKYVDFDIYYSIKDVKYFRTDATLLTSVFQNLIDNAYRYSSAGKKHMRISIYTQNRQIFFKFEDKGIGIANSEKENVFKKFYRINSEYNQQGSVGLGLAFCKEVVMLMRGDISVESKLGAGTIFTMTLPYNDRLK